MYVQISNGQMINLRNVSTIFTDDRNEDYPERFLIRLEKFDHEDGWYVSFKTSKERQDAFIDLMRKVNCIEWQDK